MQSMDNDDPIRAQRVLAGVACLAWGGGLCWLWGGWAWPALWRVCLTGFVVGGPDCSCGGWAWLVLWWLGLAGSGGCLAGGPCFIYIFVYKNTYLCTKIEMRCRGAIVIGAWSNNGENWILL